MREEDIVAGLDAAEFKLRGHILVPTAADKSTIEQLALANETVLKHTNGQSPKKVVVVPYNVPGCNDYSTYGSGRTPRDLLQIMKDQFDYLYWEGEQGAPKFFAFNLHTFVSGVPFRS